MRLRRKPNAAYSAFTDLPFIALRDGKKLPKAKKGQPICCFWHVTPTHNYKADCKTGEQLADTYLDFISQYPDDADLLPEIISDMPKPMTGIEIGFLSNMQLIMTQSLHPHH